MKFLHSQRVLHGDLAARNILLADNNTVKICDFGMARTLYKTNNYKKKPGAKLPLKWLAMESFEWLIFNERTDVWSFGVLLWELFSLGRIPYPHIPTGELLDQLKEGYRLEKPEHANETLYSIMLDCWDSIPENRPSFAILEQIFTKILGRHLPHVGLKLLCERNCNIFKFLFL